MKSPKYNDNCQVEKISAICKTSRDRIYLSFMWKAKLSCFVLSTPGARNCGGLNRRSVRQITILTDGIAIETLLMTAKINTDLVNHPVLLTTEPSTILVRVGTDACKSIINSILRYKDYDSHKNAHKDLQKRFIDNRSIDTVVQFMIVMA
ncbi:uncharacterized protein TNCV_2290981 [Trichonephila clavipes]|uniref:Uncharacterized protein n=1 Tax=Trichonephila clavipes TaxID=2585209 RepID=A0A8X6RTI0_TRICX|nr:uncharacterized protein TNCV_2290981 [Trichonephila clavipes]